MNKKIFIIKIFFIVLTIYAYYNIFCGNFIHLLTPYKSYIWFICDILIIILGFSTLFYKKNLLAILFFFGFLISSTITFFLNKESIYFAMHLNGLRNILVIFFSIFFLNIILQSKYAGYFYKKMNHFLKIFICIQLPLSIYQFIRKGASDAVKGSLHTSGLLTIIIFPIIFYLFVIYTLEKKRDKFSLKSFIKYTPFIIPAFINETKITFFILPVFFFLLLKINISLKNILQTIIIVITGFFVFIYFNKIYKSTTADRGYRLSYEIIFSKNFLERYLYASYRPELGERPPRLLRIDYGFRLIKKQSETLFWGLGYGIFKGGTLLERCKRSEEIKWLGLTGPTLYIYMMQGGLLNTLLLISFFLIQFFSNTRQIFIIHRLKIFLIIVFLSLLLYTHAWFGLTAILLLYLILFCKYYNYILYNKENSNSIVNENTKTNILA